MKYLIFFLIPAVFTCQQTTTKNKKATIMNQLVLYLEKNIFTPFEPIRPGVQIINTSGKEINIQKVKLDWEDLAFSSPSVLHLINENGIDIASMYEREPIYFKDIKPIAVTGKEEWFYFPLNIYFPKLAAGKYKLWVELADNYGDLLKSNTISFAVIDVMDNLKALDIAISIEESQTCKTDKLEVEVNFINKYANRLIILKPHFDSFYGWTNPAYYFVLREKVSGRVLPLALRSGSMDTPVYDQSTMFSLDGGEENTLKLKLPSIPKLSIPGEYTVQLYYLVREHQIGKSGTILSTEMNWGKDVFVGLIESNTINIKVIDK